MQRATLWLHVFSALSLTLTAGCFGPGSGGGGGVPAPCVANPSLPQCVDATTTDVVASETTTGDTAVTTDTPGAETTTPDAISPEVGSEVSTPDGGPITGDITTGCTNGALRCTGNVVETCAGGSWSTVAACGAQETCVGGACIPATCEPDCAGKTCGPDGCGGTCGTCDTGSCVQGTCQCVSDCGTKECGLDSCGESCGTCAAGETCSASGICEGPICTPSCGECGPDGCGGSCGNCPAGWNCQAGACIQQGCTPDCTGKACGDDGCGGVCGTCQAGETCDAGACTPGTTGCGGATFEGCCSGNGAVVQWCENDALQQQDCAAEGGVCSWNATQGFFLCTVEPQATPPQFPYTCGGETCSASCAGLECGFACGELCGGCPNGQACGTGNTCETCACAPGQECGTDACGNSCGTCGTNELCNGADQCILDPCALEVGIVGCCEGNLSVWCENGEPQGVTCDTTCGWDAANGYYDCNQVGADPSGTNPLSCSDI